MDAGPHFSRYVALGDSTTEGIDDPYPGGAPGTEVYRGWADRLAERLAADNADLLYANLAIRGRLIGQIHDQQLQPALAMSPDLASVVGGVNDLLRPKFDLAAASAQLEATVAGLRAVGATVVMMTLPDLSSSMWVARLVSERTKAYSAAIREIAQRTGAVLADMERELAVYDPRGWSVDRLHANDVGHEYLMWGVAKALGVDEAAGRLQQMKDSAPAVEPRSKPAAAVSEAVWFWNFLRPWIGRRLRGTSSGDGITPKRPQLQPVRPVSI